MSEEKRVPLYIHDDFDPELQRRWEEEQKLKKEVPVSRYRSNTDDPLVVDLTIDFNDGNVDFTLN
jgi:hypothetical protein